MKKVIVIVLLSFAAATALFSAQAAPSNKAIARRVFDEILTKGHFELASELYAPDFVNHGRTRDVALERDQAAARGWLEAFPDLVIRPEIVISEGDLVAVSWHASGTNTGSGNGIPATGRRINGGGITVWRIEDGRLKEEWSEFSYLILMKQLGLVPGGSEVRAPTPSDGAEQPVKVVPPKTRERNRRVVRSVFERIVGNGDLDLFNKIYAKRFANHGVGGDSTVQNEIDGTVGFRRLAPDLKVTVQKTIAEGDLVAIIYLAEGTNTGAALGYPATGKRFSMRGMSIMRVDRGKITDEWSVLDQYQALSQLGLLPSGAREAH